MPLNTPYYVAATGVVYKLKKNLQESTQGLEPKADD